MNIFERVRALNLPIGEYIVFGSGPLEAHGIRKTRDTDLLVTSRLYTYLSDQPGYLPNNWTNGDRYLVFDKNGVDAEICDVWNYGEYNVTPEELIERAEFIQEIPFAPLVDVLGWKKAFGREKDLTDIKLIQEFLSKN